MEPTPEPELQPASTPIIIQHLEERPHESYFNMPFDQASGLEALSTAATSNFQYIRPLSVPVPSPVDAHASPHSSNNLNFILNPTRPETPHGTIRTIYSSVKHQLIATGISTPAIDPLLIVPPERISQPSPVTEHEVAFLLRHFGETAGQW